MVHVRANIFKEATLCYKRNVTNRFYRCMSTLSTNLTEKQNDKYFITTPIFYANAAPHIGHLYTATLADTLARWQKLKGVTAIMSTGMDEHGQKIQQAAGSTDPLYYCDTVSNQFKDVFDKGRIDYSSFIRTTDPSHRLAVHKFWNVLKSKDLIYKDSYQGWYCTADETFVGEDEVKQKQMPDGTKLMVTKKGEKQCEWSEEENYMFKLSHFEEDLRNWLQGGVIHPEVMSLSLEKTLSSLSDLSISRDRKRLQWGIPVPDDNTQTIYVWLDALVNYLTVAGYHHSDQLTCWPPDCQVIGKDILKFHAIYWPAFLMGAGLPLPKQILCHSHFMVNNEKMSKSKGNVVDPVQKIDIFSADGFRFYLMFQNSITHDGDYSDEKAMNDINATPVNVLCNLIGRCISIKINPSQTFPPISEQYFSQLPQEDQDMFHSLTSKLPGIIDDDAQHYRMGQGIRTIRTYLEWCSKLITDHKIWDLVKVPHEKEHLDTIVHMALETTRVCSILLQPVMPDLTEQILDRIGVSKDERMFKHSQISFLIPENGLPLGFRENDFFMKRISLKDIGVEKSKEIVQNKKQNSKKLLKKHNKKSV